MGRDKRGVSAKFLQRELGVAYQTAWTMAHKLRHACGFKLANGGQDTRALQHYLRHRNIHRTARYTELAAHRFKSSWQD
jgi:site-specific recombinase XerD